MSELVGKRILVVEDEALIAALLVDILGDAGADIVGPAYTVASALELAAKLPIDAAVLDMNLRGVFVGPVAEALEGRGVPFIFATGYGATPLEQWPKVPVVEKPYAKDRLLDALGSVARDELKGVQLT
jgi:CheY-like chemotaxis protein